MKVTISEARLNDLTYIALKRYFFEPVMGSSPRECDIRVCMDMAAPERITSVASAILQPNEVAGKSHTKVYEVDPEQVLEVAIGYIEDHWAKRKLVGKFDIRKDWAAVYPVLLQMDEDQCGGG